MLNNIRPTRHLEFNQFNKHYKTDIDNLFHILINNLTNRGVFIENEENFYNDFIHYVYKFSSKYKSNYDP